MTVEGADNQVAVMAGNRGAGEVGNVLVGDGLTVFYQFTDFPKSGAKLNNSLW